MIILGIETSCDETAAAVIGGKGNNTEVLSNVVSSQIEIHKKYGGVVPEVAAREHVLNILPVINEALGKAAIKTPLPPFTEWAKIGLDAIAVTIGPGLITSLQVGVETAKILACAWQLPLVAVNHIEGHIYANFISANFKFETLNSKQTPNYKLQITNQIHFPALILTVSGGHTMLILMTGHGKYKTLGQTRDDAAGEALDKAAQLLGLGYPGGPAIAAEAAKVEKNLTPNFKIPLIPPVSRRQFTEAVHLPRPMIRDKNFDFSFSGLKTALLYALRQDKNWRQRQSEYAREFQQAVADVLIHKTIKAAKQFDCKTIMLSGGVAANLELRKQLAKAAENNLSDAKLIIPDLKYCTDNAAMIASAGYFRAKRRDFTPWQKLKTDSNLELK